MYKLLKAGGQGYVENEDGYYHEYVCDTTADIATLPTGAGIANLKAKPRPGSTAVVAYDGSVYMLSNQRVWRLLIEGRGE